MASVTTILLSGGALGYQNVDGRHSMLIGLKSSSKAILPSFSSLYQKPTPIFSRKPANFSQPSFRLPCKTVCSQEDKGADGKTGSLVPTTIQVQSLLLDVCDRTTIAALKLKVGAFHLHVKRNLGRGRAAAASLPQMQPMKASSPELPLPSILPAQPKATPSTPSSAIVAPPVAAPKSNNFASSILSAPVSKTASLFGLLEAAANQGLSFVTSPKVGVFRRGRTIKGKVGKALVEEGVTIKQGQVVGYLEQLGTQQPVEAQVSGEVVQVLWQDGESVGYGDPLIFHTPILSWNWSKSSLKLRLVGFFTYPGFPFVADVF